MLPFLAAHVPDFVLGLSALGGLWAAFHRFDTLLVARIAEHTRHLPDKADLARIETKLDILLEHPRHSQKGKTKWISTP